MFRLDEFERAQNLEKTRLQQSHASQLAGLQQQLKGEREQREHLEQLWQRQSEVTIPIDDATPPLFGSSTEDSGTPKTWGKRKDEWVWSGVWFFYLEHFH